MPIQIHTPEYMRPFTRAMHIWFWVGSLISWTLFVGMTDGVLVEPFANKLCYLPAQIIITYGLLYIIVPLLFDKKYSKAILWLLPISYVATVIARILKVYVYESIIGFDAAKETLLDIATDIPKLLVQYMLWSSMFPIITLAGILVYDRLKQQERVEQLKKEKKLSELKFLKSQVHPHFLFNTLNNLYTLAFQKSKKTPLVAKQLHDIIEYMFHRSGEQMIPLKEEIQLLKNYVELEKLRYGKRLALTFDIDVDDMSYRIAPLMLITMVENAFKHGASGDIENPSINISIKLKQSDFSFLIKNSKTEKMSKDERGFRKGIGLKNLKRQLELNYTDRYTLDITDEVDEYQVQLKIKSEQ